MNVLKKIELWQKRRWRIRKKIKGTQVVPRLSLKFTNKNIIAQCIDDEAGVTLFSVGSLDKDFRDQKLGANMQSAITLGKAFGKKARSAGIASVCFDRNGKPFHGKVKAFAEASDLFKN